VVEVLAEYRPDIPVAIVSAHAGSIYQVVRRRGGRIRVLEKRFDADAVRALARELIAESRTLRAAAQAQRARVQSALERSQTLLADAAKSRAKIDLVSAAWAFHRTRTQPA
jgi:DNA-binding NtrC family response regulator